MPIFEVQTQPNDLVRRGPRLSIKISLPRVLTNFLSQQEKPIPSPIEGTVLIDTGASVSAIDLEVIEQLQLTPIGIVPLETAGGPVETNTYHARFILEGRVSTEIGDAVGVDLSGLSVSSIIGRDLLKSFIMIYNGPGGRFTLTV